MPLIWCSISGHGFGHASQVVPVLNELGRRYPNLQVVLRTTVPDHFFTHRLTVPWERSVQEQDVGCVQRGPLHIDIGATWQAYQEFHGSWERRVAEECEVMKQYAPNLVLSNISYLALEAGSRSSIPAIAFGSLAWDHVLQELADSHNPEHGSIIGHIREMYKRADLAIRLAPALPMDSFPRHLDVGPIGHDASVDQHASLHNIRKTGNGPLVLVALGGVPLTTLPFETIDQLSPYQFLMDMPLPSQYARLISAQDVTNSFAQLLGTADIILSKPGYGTVIEAVAQGKPLVYVRRYNFADEGPVVDFAHQYGRAYELSKQDFFGGAWREALDAVQTLPFPNKGLPASGIGAAADIIASYLFQYN